jgi:hypothetical protein
MDRVDELGNLALSVCNHHLCRDCLARLLAHDEYGTGVRCPMCRRVFEENGVVKAMQAKMREMQEELREERRYSTSVTMKLSRLMWAMERRGGKPAALRTVELSLSDSEDEGGGVAAVVAVVARAAGGGAGARVTRAGAVEVVEFVDETSSEGAELAMPLPPPLPWPRGQVPVRAASAWIPRMRGRSPEREEDSSRPVMRRRV